MFIDTLFSVGEEMSTEYCQLLKTVLENSNIDLSDYGVNPELLTKKEKRFTFEEIQVSLEEKQGVKIDLKTKLKSRKLIIHQHYR